MKNEIYVIDTETTGLTGYPEDYVLEISIVKVDIVKNSLEVVFDEVVGHDTKNWNDYLRNAWIFGNSSLTLEMVQKAEKIEIISEKVREILKDKQITSFNTSYDLNKFLYKNPWNLREVIDKEMNCIMLSATQACKIPGYYDDYKWPRLEEAYNILIEEQQRGDYEFHRSLADTIISAQILLKLYPEYYKI
jgi:DNA polymerase-3 subunit epsilon